MKKILLVSLSFIMCLTFIAFGNPTKVYAVNDSGTGVLDSVGDEDGNDDTEITTTESSSTGNKEFTGTENADQVFEKMFGQSYTDGKNMTISDLENFFIKKGRETFSLFQVVLSIVCGILFLVFIVVGVIGLFGNHGSAAKGFIGAAICAVAVALILYAPYVLAAFLSWIGTV